MEEFQWIDGRLSLDVLEKPTLLFNVFEDRNGSRARRFNEMDTRLFLGLNEDGWPCWPNDSNGQEVE